MKTLRNELLYADMPKAREWADTFEEGIKAYGISADQIQRYNDTDTATMDNVIYSGANSARAKII